jgi:hypothetical protein
LPKHKHCGFIIKDDYRRMTVKRILSYAAFIIIGLGLFACAPGDKQVEDDMAQLLSGPYYTVTVRSMLREDPDLDAEATGVMAAGQEVHLRSMSEDEKWALVAAHTIGEVVFTGWIPSDRIRPSED